MSINPTYKKKAIKLRLSGKSYSEILKELQLKSKGTLSVWFRDLELPQRTKELLRDNVDRAVRRKFFEFNKQRTNRIRSENDMAYLEGKNLVGTITERELMLIGAALYWGEGTKFERVGGTAAIVFTNSDPTMIKIFLRFIREIIKTPEERIRAGINLYDSKKIACSRKFWAQVTGLPTERFYVSQLVSSASTGKRDGNRLPYGTVCIRISNRIEFYRIKGAIAGIAGTAGKF